MNYFKTEKRTAFIAVLLIFVIFLPFSVHSAHADDAETVNSWPQAPSVYGASACLEKIVIPLSPFLILCSE